jgi:hypothetical protein
MVERAPEAEVSDQLPVLVGAVIALLGTLGGVAAILKVSSDNADTIADGAGKVVELMDRRLQDAEDRLARMEVYHIHLEQWVDRLLDILQRAVALMPDFVRDEYDDEVSRVKGDRPRR